MVASGRRNADARGARYSMAFPAGVLGTLSGVGAVGPSFSWVVLERETRPSPFCMLQSLIFNYGLLLPPRPRPLSPKGRGEKGSLASRKRARKESPADS